MKIGEGYLYNRCAIEVANELEPQSVRLVYCDGPYGLEFGDWDMAKGKDLVEWYRPFFDSFDRICMPSCNLVVWGRSDSWAWLHCELINRGWKFAGSAVWAKPSCFQMRSDPAVCRSWPQSHEQFGIHRRDELETDTCASTVVAYAAGGSDENWIRVWLRQQWEDAGFSLSEADTALGTRGMAGHYFGKSQWSLPTLKAFMTLGKYAQENGKRKDGLPWFIHPSSVSCDLHDSYKSLQGSWEELQKSYQHLADEFERMRAPYNWEKMVGSVWNERTPTARATRHGHPCEKAPSLTRRLIEVLSNPGDVVFEPFGGSSPVARCIEGLPEAKKRKWVSCELDANYVEQTKQMLTNVQGNLF